MLIILEGCDGSGKSTLANMLSMMLNAEVIHATRETPNDYLWFCEIMNEAKKRNILMDRSFWGQFVYQEPEERNLDSIQKTMLEKRLQEEGGKLIYVRAPNGIIRKRLKKRHEELSLPLTTIKKRYMRLSIEAQCPVIWYNSHTGVSNLFCYRKGEHNETV